MYPEWEKLLKGDFKIEDDHLVHKYEFKLNQGTPITTYSNNEKHNKDFFETVLAPGLE